MGIRRFRPVPLLALAVLVVAVLAGPVFTPSARAVTQGGSCDGFSGAVPLGASYTDSKVTVPACGPQPMLGGSQAKVYPYPGALYTAGYQCVEFSERYLYYEFGVTMPESTNGDQVVDHYAARYPSLFTVVSNGTPGRAPAKGDVLSFSDVSSFNELDGGHTAVVQSSSVDSAGDGTITIIEENGGSYAANGSQVLTVKGWNVQYSTYPYVKWLHPAGPSSPGGVSAAERDHSLVVSWSASGGTSYTATASPGGASCSTGGVSCVITGLQNDVSYSVSVTASSSGVTSLPSTVTAVPRPVNADYLGSGYSDLAWLTGEPGGPRQLWLFDGGHGFSTAGETTGWGIPEPGVAGDFTGNGRSEIAWFQPTKPGGPTGSIYLVSWNGTNWQATLARGPGVGRPLWVGAGDFAGTGYDDLAWLTKGPSGKPNTLWLFDGRHGFATAGETTGWGAPDPGAVGDFSDNGRSEIAWFQPAKPGAPTGSIYLVSWNGSAWGAQLGRGPGVGIADFVATTSSSYDPPTVTRGPVVTLAAGAALPSPRTASAVPVKVSWTTAPGGGPVCSQAVQRSVNGGATWTSLPAPRAAATSLRTTLTPGRHTMFRVRATGCGGVLGSWATSAPVTAHLEQQTAAGVRYSAGWKKETCAACSGRSQERTARRHATVTVKVSGTAAIALVMTEGPADGSAAVTGAGRATVSTHAARTRYRKYAYAHNWAAAGKRRVTVTNLATARHPDLRLDAIITLT